MGFSWFAFLLMMKQRGILLSMDVEYFEKEENKDSSWIGFVVRLEDYFINNFHAKDQRITQLESALRDMGESLEPLLSHGLAHYEDCSIFCMNDDEAREKLVKQLTPEKCWQASALYSAKLLAEKDAEIKMLRDLSTKSCVCLKLSDELFKAKELLAEKDAEIGKAKEIIKYLCKTGIDYHIAEKIKAILGEE